MGGPGSGSIYHWWRPPKRTVVELCREIDANRWAREGMLRAGKLSAGSWTWTYADGRQFVVRYAVAAEDMAQPFVLLSYSWARSDGGEDSEEYPVRLATTRPRFGGVRWWWLCPLEAKGAPCRQRVAKLYLPPGGRHFGCRRCHNLTYLSCQESHKGRPPSLDMAGLRGADLKTIARMIKRIRLR